MNKRRDQRRSVGQGQRQSASGLPQLFGHVGRGVPSAVGDIDIEQADEELREHRRGGGAHGRMREIVPASVAESKARHKKRQDDQNLEGRQHVLHARRAPDAQAIDDGEQRDQIALATICAPPNLNSHAPDPIDMLRAVQPQAEKEMSEIIGEGQRGGGDGRGESGEEGNPSGHESPGGAVGLGQVDVFAAGAGEVHSQFGVAERAGQRAHRADAPDQQHQLRGAQLSGEESRGGENAGADHVGDDQRRRAADPELAEQRGRSWRQDLYVTHGERVDRLLRERA